MGLTNFLAQRRAWRRGVVHTTLNPAGPGCVRIHLIPPKWKFFGNPSYVVILNGYYILPLGYSWAVLLEQFILEVDKFEGAPIDEAAMARVIRAAVDKAHRIYYDVPRQELLDDLMELLGGLFEIAHGRTPGTEIGALSLREYAPHMSAPHRMDLMVSAMTDGAGEWHCNLKCRHCYAAGQPGAGGAELSTAQWKGVIDRCRAAGIPSSPSPAASPPCVPTW